jgi:predicted Mrr-cat superfamily restriction endonuclease
MPLPERSSEHGTPASGSSGTVVSLKMPNPGKEKAKHRTPEECVRECIKLIESGYESNVEWKLLNRTYNKLKKMRKTKRVRNLIAMIEPILSKHGQHGVAERDG